MLPRLFCFTILTLFSFITTMAVDSQSKGIERFSSAVKIIKSSYVKDITENDIFDGAIRGMLHQLDPHSMYLDQDDLKSMREQTNGSFGGIGIEIELENGILKVITPLDESPAAKAGIKSGDIITHVDGKQIINLTSFEIVNAIRGKMGTDVILTVYSPGSKNPKEVTVTRDIIKLESVKLSFPTSDIARIRIASFSEKTHDEIKKATDTIMRNETKIKGVILDLRNNPGGLLTAAVDVTDQFLDARKLGNNTKIVYTQGRDKYMDNYSGFASKVDAIHGLPLVVLINQGSASASEIVAIALQDHHRATIVGQKSFGKGSVQSIITIDRQHALKLTTALYFSPNGRQINGIGVTPDVFVYDITINKSETKPNIGESSFVNYIKSQYSPPEKPREDTIKELANIDPYIYEAIQILDAKLCS